jgi:ATP-binding cassette subfamily F protein uup
LKSTPHAPAAPSATKPATPRRKLGYKEARELEQLPARIEALEAEIAARTAAIADPAFYRQGSAAIVAANDALAALQRDLDAAYARWSALDA